jgi:hypothetical protein
MAKYLDQPGLSYLWGQLKTKLSVPVGSIMQGYNNPFGAKGALCNGALYRNTVYPSLFSMSPGAVTYYSEYWSGLLGLNRVNGIKYLNGLYVAYGGITGSDFAGLSYATSLAGPWTAIQIYPQSSCPANNVEYVNGYWVCFFGNSYICFSPTLTAGSWPFFGNSISISSIAWNGTYYLCSGFSNQFYYGTTIAGMVLANYPDSYGGMVIANGATFVISATTSNRTSARLFYGSNPAALSTGPATPISANDLAIGCGIIIVNGYYIWTEYMANGSGFSLYYTNNLAVAPTRVDMTSSSNLICGNVAYIDGYYIVTVSNLNNSTGAIYYSASLGGPYSFGTVPTTPSMYSPILKNGAEYVVPPKNNNNVVRTSLLGGDCKNLPNIAASNGFNFFIKTTL